MKPSLRWAAALLAMAAASSFPVVEAAPAAGQPPAMNAAALPAPPLAAAEQIDARIRRAIAWLAAGDTLGARVELSGCDFAVRVPVAGLDRAAFLLGWLELARGSRGGFLKLTESVLEWPDETVYTRWLKARREFELTASAAGGGARFALSRLNPFVQDSTDARILGALTAAALEASGGDAASAWARVAGGAASTDIDAELAGVAAMQAARAAAARGESPLPFLNRVPAASRYGEAARRIAGALDPASAASSAAAPAVSAAPPATPAAVPTPAGPADWAESPNLRLAEAARRLDAGDWEGADRLYAGLEQDAAAAEQGAAALADSAGVSMVWRSWNLSNDFGRRLALASPPLAGNDPLWMSASDARRPEPTTVTLPRLAELWLRPGGAIAALPPPTPAERSAAEHLAAERADVAQRLAETAAEQRMLREAAGREARWYERGERARHNWRVASDSLALALAKAQAEWPGALDRLAELVAREQQRLVERAGRIAATAADLDLKNRWSRHLFVEGPLARRSAREAAVAGAAGAMLEVDRRVNAEVQSAAARLAADAPGLIARSLEEMWRPSLLDPLGRMVAANEALRERDDRLGAALAAARLDALNPERLTELDRATARRFAEADSLRAADADLRRRVVLAAADRLRDQRHRQEEAIDLGRATSAYRLALAAAGDDTALAAGRLVAAPAPAGEAVAGTRHAALERLRYFLAAHPESRARGEARYWLADLLLSEARDEFQAKMLRFTAGAAESDSLGGSRSPNGSNSPNGGDSDRRFAGFVDYAPALEVFRAILAEDRDYAHTDAVLYHAGMILSEQGEPAADEMLRRLVAEYPSSPFVQESTLRLAEDALAARDEQAVPLLEAAAAGPDPALRVVALYRLGWARSAQEQYEAASIAFRRLLDEYASGRPILLKTDLRAEAIDCLVQCLARAGGAPAFEAVFTSDEAGGGRSYASDLLDRLGATLHEASLYRDAVAADQLYLRRYPAEPRALGVGARLLSSYEKWNQAEAALAAREMLGGLFAPGSDWARAQAADSLKSAGAELARVALADAAVEHHRRAREAEGAAAEWAKAADLYARLLRLWPDHADVPRLHLYAGEVAEKQGRPADARGHYDLAAERDTAAWGTEALWCRARLELAGDDPAAAAGDLAAYRSREAARPDRLLEGIDLEIEAWHRARKPLQAAERLMERAAKRTEAAEAAPALYRAGLDYTEGGRGAQAIMAWRELVDRYHDHELAADALLQIAEAQVAAEPLSAAATYRRFAEQHAQDHRAPDAWLKSVDLIEASGDTTAADQGRRGYLSRFPNDTERGRPLRETLARHELSRMPAGGDLAALLKSPTSDLAAYLKQMEKSHTPPAADIASRVAFERAEAAGRACNAVPLNQPLAKSLARRKKLLSDALAAYARCGEDPASGWARAAAFRSGELLVQFGEALKSSQRPAGLSGADLAAYDDVVDRQAWSFFDRGEKIWSDLLKPSPGRGAPDRWLLATRQALWPRLAQRFYFRPEIEYPPQAERGGARHHTAAPARSVGAVAAAPDGGEQIPAGGPR